MHFTHRVPTNISCNIQYTQNIHFYFYTSDKLILKNKCSFIFPYNWCILLISTQRTALHFDTEDVLELALQNILFLLIHLIYWYLRIYSLSIDTFNNIILVFFLCWYLWYIGILAEEIRFSTWTSFRRWKGNGTTKKVTFIFTTSTILMSQRNLSDLSICFQIFWGGFLIIFSDYIKCICHRILCFVPGWIGWHFNALATREACKFSWELVARHFEIVIQISIL